MVAKHSNTTALYPSLRRFIFILPTVMLLCSMAKAAITTSVNRNHIDRTDNLILLVQVDDNARGSQPNFSPLQQDWRILATSQKSEISWSNGQLSTTSTWRLTLAPQREGLLQIPVLTWANSRSQPIAVRVAPISESLEQQLARVAFFKSSVSQGSYWVQSQVLYEVTLFYTQEVQLQGNPLQQPKLPDTIVLPLGAAQTGTELIDGVRYWILKQSYALFPQTSGQLVIPGMRGLGYAYLTPRRDSRKRIEIRSQRHVLKVLPKPAAYPAGVPWIPAANLTLSSEWQGVPSPLNVNDVATLIIRTKVQGLPPSSIANLPVPTLTTGRLYSHPPQSEESLSANGITSDFISTVAVIPTESGNMQLSPMAITWWDTKQGRVRESILNIPALEVLRPITEVVEAAPKQQLQQPFWVLWLSDVWLWTSAFFALAWLVSIGYVLYLRRQIQAVLPGRSAPDEAENTTLAAHQALTLACRQKDAAAIRQALEAWAISLRPQSHGSALAKLLSGDDEGRSLVENLNKHLYQDMNTHFDPIEILAWAKRKRSAQTPDVTSSIAPLYPAG